MKDSGRAYKFYLNNYFLFDEDCEYGGGSTI
jgi:hypothetical protein